MINIPMNVASALGVNQLNNNAFAKKNSMGNLNIGNLMQGLTGQTQTGSYNQQPMSQGYQQNGYDYSQQNNQGFNQQNNFGQQTQGFNQQNNFGQQGQNFNQQNQGFSQQGQNFGQQNNFGYQPQQNQGFNQQNNFNQQQAPQQMPVQNRQRPAATGVILKKGQKTSLSQLCPGGLDLIQVGLGWDLGPNGQGYDLDVEAFMLGASGKVIGDDWFVFYNQPDSPDGSVRLLCDSKTGAGDGDDEIIQVQLSRLNPQVTKIVFIVSINEAKQYGYNFSNVANAYVRIVDMKTKNEIARFQLTDYYANVNSMIVAELYNHNGAWKLNPVGDGVSADLMDLCLRYGVNVGG